MNTKKIPAIIGAVIIILVIASLIYTARSTDNSDSNSDTASSTGVVATSTQGSATTSPVSSGTTTKTPRPVPLKADDSKATSAGVSDAVFANNEFALNEYIQLAKGENGVSKGKNVLFSPFSITTALSMVYEGARATTSEEIANVLLMSDANVRRNANARLYNDINTANPAYTFKVANALWVEKTLPISQTYTNTINTYYKGAATPVDFINQREISRATINQWVAKQTNNKIQELLPIGSIGSYTRLVLTNAVYFKGKWATQFNKDYTRQAQFTVSSSTKTIADMMTIAGKEFSYASTTAGEILELPYAGNRLSMIFVVDHGTSMTSSDITALREKMEKQKVNIFIPRFKAETTYSLNDSLTTLGMPTAFTDEANFTGISAKGGLKISRVDHKAFIEVNEEGTEAAAATGVNFSVTSVPVAVPEFRADRPFLFMIRDTKTDAIIFMGKIVNPSI